MKALEIAKEIKQYPPEVISLALYAPFLVKGYNDLEDVVTLAEELITVIPRFNEEWKLHPQFDECPDCHNPWNPIVAYEYHHEPGIDGETKSYIIGGIVDVACSDRFQWGLKKMGRFARVISVADWMPVSNDRYMYYSVSYNGRGKGYHARRVLKELLPKKLHRHIAAVRGIDRKPKTNFLSGLVLQGKVDLNDKTTFPEWYNEYTKKELYLLSYQYQQVWDDVSAYITPENFYDVCNGAVHPNDVPDMCTRQLALPLIG